jgi:hypothetical protein
MNAGRRTTIEATIMRSSSVLEREASGLLCSHAAITAWNRHELSFGTARRTNTRDAKAAEAGEAGDGAEEAVAAAAVETEGALLSAGAADMLLASIAGEAAGGEEVGVPSTAAKDCI